MKKGILCILLSLFLLAPLLSACQHEADFTETAANIYTLYTITDEKTTPEAIRQVELALNRTIFYRLGVIVKLVAVTEDKYDQLIADKFAEMEAYQEEKKNKKSSKTSGDSSADGESSEVMTGDRIVANLDKGIDIELTEPRLDIFLVRGYENYYNLATTGKITALDEKLNNEAKALKSSIHSTFFTAAKVNKKVYGVPVNTAIGEYVYIVFDEEYLDKYNVDPNTIKTMDDLQDYLSVIKANEPDVVPLESAMPSADISFLSNEGFPALVNSSGAVVTAYDNTKLLDYFAMTSRYQALGYFESADKAADAKYAVRFVSGNTDDIDALEKETGRTFQYSLYSNPVATNENTIDNVFCISKYVVSNQLTDVAKLITAINTDEQLMNLLTYGIEGTHYLLDENKQVSRLNEDYMMNPQYMGNSFITYTVAGENPDKWKNAIKQNQDAVVSPSLGFTVDYASFEYDDEDNNTIKVFEPNYIDIINKVVDKYYPALINGTAIEYDYNAIREQAVSEINAELEEELTALYATRLNAQFSESIRESVVKSDGARLQVEAEEEVISQIKKSLVNPLTQYLITLLKEEFPDATDEELKALAAERLTDEFINENLYYQYSEERVGQMIQGIYDNKITAAVNSAVKDFMDSSDYQRALQNATNSAAYKSELEKMLTYDAPDKVNDRFDLLISSDIAEYAKTMIDEMSTDIEAAVNAFIDEYSGILDLTKDQILTKINYLEAAEEEGETYGDESSEAEGEGEGEGDEEDDDGTFTSWFDFVFKIKLRKMYYGIFGEPQ